jgi:hypothetical protein
MSQEPLRLLHVREKLGYYCGGSIIRCIGRAQKRSVAGARF